MTRQDFDKLIKDIRLGGGTVLSRSLAINQIQTEYIAQLERWMENCEKMYHRAIKKIDRLERRINKTERMEK